MLVCNLLYLLIDWIILSVHLVPAMAALNNAVPVLVHVLLYKLHEHVFPFNGCKLTHESCHCFVASASMLSNDQLAQGPNGSWKNMDTLKLESHKSSISQISCETLDFSFGWPDIFSWQRYLLVLCENFWLQSDVLPMWNPVLI
ncbi:hypothetical protein E2542_SST19316 [Spatholobus suberectus]|nr:hypothetical protein E2542_SST19316 [Spatholobus suberectus]